MRRNSALVVDTTTTTTLTYDLDASPRSSILSPVDLKDPQAFETPASNDLPPVQHNPPPPSLQPSIQLLFSLLSRRDVFVLLLPAILSSIVAGGVAPFMTYVVGQAFSAFAQFPLTPNPTDEDKHKLLHGVGLAAVELVALGLGAFILSSITSSFWICAGERNVMALRQRVYKAVSEKDLSWFSSKMGAQDGDVPIGAGGMMAKFTRETDDVRMATSLAAGYLVQYITTCLACLILAFIRSWALTLVILSAVPVLVFIQAISQNVAAPLLAAERAGTAAAGSMLDRVITAISTVKAFNAESYEHASLSRTFDGILNVASRLNAVWGFTSALSQFTTMAMFVQGFWFGSKLVRDGKIAPGDVMAVFWACLIATSNLQMCIPQLIALAKGKFAMVALLTVVYEAPSHKTVLSTVVVTPDGHGNGRSGPRRRLSLRKIAPYQCHGEVSLHNVTFTYPTLNEPTLKDISLFLPANEMTFIVGSSGSGKSTIAALLMNMYTPDVGTVALDETDIRYIDDRWMKSAVCGVGQGWSDVILEGASIRDNVRLGVEDVGDEEVEEACRLAFLHQFVRDLPEGYETVLGGGVGVALSGGQRQRLAIARAILRNPAVMVLDEATSALDATSRILVFEALKIQRRNKTTIVITHDLSQVGPGDFVYVMKDGRVVEQGFRCDLEEVVDSVSPISIHEGRGEFRKMLDVQLGFGGFLPTKELAPLADTSAIEFPSQEEHQQHTVSDEEERLRRHQTLLRPLTFGNWMFEAVADLTAPVPAYTATVEVRHETTRRQSPTREEYTHQRRPSSLHIDIPPAPVSAVEREHRLKRMSLQFTPTSPVFSVQSMRKSRVAASQVYGKETEYGSLTDMFPIDEELPDYRSEGYVKSRRELVRKRREILSKENLLEVSVADPAKAPTTTADPSAPAPFWKTMSTAFHTVPYKPFFFFGLLICAMSGAMTPVFSYLLSRLLFEVSTGATDVNIINAYGGIVLGIAAFDGLLLGFKYFLMESAGMKWVTALRKHTLELVLKQDRSWFDKAENSSIRLVQMIVKDGDDARNLIAVVAGQCFVVVSMLGVGLIWALVRGWELTFVGFAIAPIFATVMAVQTKLVADCEMRNKKAREDVAKGYYEAISNVKGIRAMAFEPVFQSRFDKAASRALSTGVKGAFVEGCSYGVASGLIYLAEALLFYVGAVLIAKGRYTYLQMVEVLNLVVFTVTIGSQLMAFTQRIAKSTQATNDFMHLLEVTKNPPAESQGRFCPQINGSISLEHVTFNYPERHEASVLRDVNLTISPGECVALVGASGSGKSTLAGLLQRLYEPTSGQVRIGGSRLSDIDVHYLRQQMSVVSQTPYLFDSTVSDNVKYGSSTVSEVDVRRAAKLANAHEFVMGLPKGYDTHVGENGALISGGQAQRLAIARALARPSSILILDECTSALDPENQKLVMEAITQVVRDGTQGRTTVMVTHKLQVMRMCGRIIVLDNGEVKEQGSYEELMMMKGTFATLARGGEWVSD